MPPWPSPTQTYHRATYPSIDPTRPELSTKGKTVVITGGGAGIGALIAEGFAQSGAAHIALLGRRPAAIETTAKALQARFPSTAVLAYAADITDRPALEQALAAVVTDTGGPIHVLIANAGYSPALVSLETSDPDDWFRAYDVNVRGNYNLIRAFLPHRAPGAAVVHVNTAISHMLFPGNSGYSSSKIASAQLFRYLHLEHPDLFVLSVHPGVYLTDMHKKADESIEGGVNLPVEDDSLARSYFVWAVSNEARFLNGKFVWAHWDVGELARMEPLMKKPEMFTMGLVGYTA